ncbi:MAG: hypothetical protein J6N74_08695, partial [Chryseobacterium sp.]|nr:hypothetical protein [Chryseobacterium sp.]
MNNLKINPDRLLKSLREMIIDRNFKKQSCKSLLRILLMPDFFTGQNDQPMLFFSISSMQSVNQRFEFSPDSPNQMGQLVLLR